jgi:hypothetical protein
VSGLSPDALCRNVNDSSTFLSENDSSLLEIQTKFEFRFDAIKKLLTARWTMKSFPSTTLIRLYELLKNSRLNDRYRSTTKKPDCLRSQAALVLRNWWRMTGSNRRPPACKAGALPAELIPQGFGWDGGSGWSRTNDPRLIKTVL